MQPGLQSHTLHYYYESVIIHYYLSPTQYNCFVNYPNDGGQKMPLLKMGTVEDIENFSCSCDGTTIIMTHCPR